MISLSLPLLAALAPLTPARPPVPAADGRPPQQRPRRAQGHVVNVCLWPGQRGEIQASSSVDVSHAAVHQQLSRSDQAGGDWIRCGRSASSSLLQSEVESTMGRAPDLQYDTPSSRWQSMTIAHDHTLLSLVQDVCGVAPEQLSYWGRLVPTHLPGVNAET